jgi:hypothetical protein
MLLLPLVAVLARMIRRGVWLWMEGDHNQPREVRAIAPTGPPQLHRRTRPPTLLVQEQRVPSSETQLLLPQRQGHQPRCADPVSVIISCHR